MIKSPCFNCPNRAMSCHNKCEPYTDYRARIDDLNNMVDDCLSSMSKMKMYKGW